MRLSVDYDHLPESLPRGLYEESTPQEKVPPVVHESDRIQEELVRNIMAQIDPLFFNDPFIFPLSAEVMMAFSQLTVATATGLIPPDSNFQCIVVNDGKKKYYQLSNLDEDILATGGAGEIVSYACKHQPAALDAIVYALRMNFVMPPVPSENVSDLEQLLSFYREQRNGSPGMERASKIEELTFIDQDHVITKFNPAHLDVTPRHTTAIHFGAGDCVSNSVLGLRPFYERVICVDPRLITGQDYIASTYSDYVLPEGDIYSDVAFGDGLGMTVEPYRALLDYLYPLSEHRLIVVKLALARGYRARGFLLLKPRPHNLEIIVHLTPDGDELDDIYEQLHSSVVEANEIRNERVLKMIPSDELKPIAGDSGFVRDLVTRNIKRMPIPEVKFKRGVRALHISAALGGKRKSKRIADFNAAFKKICEGESLGFHAPGYMAKLRAANIFELDPGFPNVRFSAATLYAAIERSSAYGVKPQHGGFLIFKKK